MTNDPAHDDPRAAAVGLADSPLPALDEALSALEPSLIEILSDLVRTSSQNWPPNGEESACQQKVAAIVRAVGLEPDIYEPTAVPSITQHPEYWPGRDYRNRPNVNAVRKGAGGGQSLILSGHIDTVPAHTPVPWAHPPLGAEIHDGKLYGRGAWDMKAGIAMNLAVLQALHRAKIQLKGDLTFESVVDEEYGGANGTLAGRLRGYGADAAIVTEPTSLKICPAQRGGRTVHITLFGPGGILGDQVLRCRAVDQLIHVLGCIESFQQRRERRVAIHPYYTNSKEPFAVWVTNVATGEWGWTQPITIPERCNLELYWQAMPGETQAEIEGEFHEWWAETLASRPELFPVKPEVRFPIRWLSGCAIPADHPLVREFAAATKGYGEEVIIEGLDAPADMYLFQNCFGIPALMWGADGAGAHQADEFVDLASLLKATAILARFVCQWCGVEKVG